MQHSRLYTVLFALFAFSLFAFASPVASKELAVARNDDPLTVILNIFLDLQVKIKAIIDVYAKLDVKADISVFIGQIVVLVNASITALVSVGAVLDLSDKDKISAIAKVVAAIIVDLQASIKVFAAIAVNVLAVVNLDVALKALLLQLNINVVGIVAVIAPLVVSVVGVVNLPLTLVLGVLGLL